MNYEGVEKLMAEIIEHAEEQRRLHTVAVKNSKDGSFAALVECRCIKDGQPRSCEVLKTAYIFDTDKEAIRTAWEMKRGIIENGD